MTDPVLDNAGKTYHFGYGSVSKKTGTPALSAGDIGDIDLILLSHHQHQDNFDKAGKAFAAKAPLIISTKKAAKRLHNAVGLSPWDSYSIETAIVPGLRIIATPAQHHPKWLPEFLSGTVVGFIIEYDNQNAGVIYISGDTVLFNQLETVGDKYKIDKLILHLGSVQFRYLTGFGKFTMDARDGVQLTENLNPHQVIPIHTHGWSHFKETQNQAKTTFSNSAIADKTLWLESGKRYKV